MVGSWALIAQDPMIFAVGSTRYIAFAGDREKSNADPYNASVEDYATSTDGKAWTLGTGSLMHSPVSGSSGTAAIDDGGQPLTAIATGTGVTFHVGVDAANRPASGSDDTTGSSGNSPGTPGVARDAKSGAVWAVWSSGDGGAHKDGVWAQQVLPAKGALLRGPQSSAANGTTAFSVAQDLSAAARTSGGVYTGYVTPARRSVAIWKLGAAKPLATFSDVAGPTTVVVTPALSGRIWAYWEDGTGWHATRSNKAATKFGPVTNLTLPKGDSSDAFIAGTGPAGPLESLALLTTGSNNFEVVARQVLPRLSITVSPGSVKAGHSFTATVTDAGDPVAKAVVHFGSRSAKTSAKGKVTVKVSDARPGGQARGDLHAGRVRRRGHHGHRHELSGREQDHLCPASQ